MVMRNEEVYLSVNCKPSPCDSLLLPLAQLQWPNIEESSGHVCNTESSTGLSRHLTASEIPSYFTNLCCVPSDQSSGLKDSNSSKLQH